MRVIQVTPTPFGPSGILGGGERYPLELARALATAVDCELLTFGPVTATHQEQHGLVIRTLHANRYLHGHPAHPLSIAILAAARHADIVHIHQMRSIPGKLGALAAKLWRSRAAVTDHGMYGSDWGGLLQRLFDAFLLVSAFSARMVHAPAARTQIIYGGVDVQRFSPLPTEDRNGVLFVGRLTPHKGIDRLIAALPRATRLTVVGTEGHDPHLPERDYPQYLRRLAAEKDVRFFGAATERELTGLYRRAQVCVLPSVERTCYGRAVAVSELLGLVVLEAMASATPVICSRIGGIPEIVVDGVTGFLVEPGDVKGLGERLTLLLRDTRKARAMGEAGRDLVCQRFTWAACAERCLAAYERILSQ